MTNKPIELDVHVIHTISYCGEGTCMYDDGTLVINGSELSYPPQSPRVGIVGIDPINDNSLRVLNGIVAALKHKLGYDLDVDVEAYMIGADMDPTYRIGDLELILRTFLEASGQFVVTNYEFTYDDQWEDYYYDDWGDDE